MEKERFLNGQGWNQGWEFGCLMRGWARRTMGSKRCGCLGSLEGLTVGNLGTTSSGWNRTSLPSRDILFQSGFLPHSSQFLIAYFLNNIILIKSTSVHWDKGWLQVVLVFYHHFDHGRAIGHGSIQRR